MTRKAFLPALLTAFGLTALAAKAQPASPTIKWGVGRLVFARWRIGRAFPAFEMVTDSTGKRMEREPDGWSVELDETLEIGLRDDGLLMWRKAEPKP